MRQYDPNQCIQNDYISKLYCFDYHYRIQLIWRLFWRGILKMPVDIVAIF